MFLSVIIEDKFVDNWRSAAKAVGATSNSVGYSMQHQSYRAAMRIDEKLWFVHVTARDIEEAYYSLTIPDLVFRLANEILDQAHDLPD